MKSIYVIDYGIRNNIFLQYSHNLEQETEYYVNSDGIVYSLRSKKVLKPNLTKKGYHKVGIYIDGISHPVTVHKMVGLTWLVSDFIQGYDINHKNGNKTDNRAENLEWVTRSRNIQHAFDTGLKHGVRGDDNSITKYKDADVTDAICLLNTTDLSVKEISKLTNIPTSYLYTILRGESRKSIISETPINRDRIATHKPIMEPEISEVKELYRTMTAKEVAKLLGITVSRVYNIVLKR